MKRSMNDLKKNKQQFTDIPVNDFSRTSYMLCDIQEYYTPYNDELQIFEVRINDPDANNANPSTIYFSMLEYEIMDPATGAINTGPRPPFRIDKLTGIND